MIKRAFVAAATSLGIASAQVDPDVEREALAAIDDMRAAFAESVAKGDGAEIMAMTHPDAMMVGPAGPVWDRVYGDGAAQGLPMAKGTKLEIQPKETVVMSPEWAFETGNTSMRYEPEPGVILEGGDTYMMLFRNDGSGWKLYREVASARRPMMPE